MAKAESYDKRITFRAPIVDLKYYDTIKEKYGFNTRSEVIRYITAMSRDRYVSSSQNSNLQYILFVLFVTGYLATVSGSIVWNILFFLILSGVAISLILRDIQPLSDN